MIDQDDERPMRYFIGGLSPGTGREISKDEAERRFGHLDFVDCREFLMKLDKTKERRGQAVVVEYEIWRVEGGKVTKFATKDGRQEALDLVDKYAHQEPGVLWEVYEVTSERIHYVEFQKPNT